MEPDDEPISVAIDIKDDAVTGQGIGRAVKGFDSGE